MCVIVTCQLVQQPDGGCQSLQVPPPVAPAQNFSYQNAGKLFATSAWLMTNLYNKIAYHEFNVLVELRPTVLSMASNLQSSQELGELHCLDTVLQIGFQVVLKYNGSL